MNHIDVCELVKRITKVESILDQITHPQWFGKKYRESQMWATHTTILDSISEIQANHIGLFHDIYFLREEIDEINKLLSVGKKPYKCPVCDAYL